MLVVDARGVTPAHTPAWVTAAQQRQALGVVDPVNYFDQSPPAAQPAHYVRLPFASSSAPPSQGALPPTPNATPTPLPSSTTSSAPVRGHHLSKDQEKCSSAASFLTAGARGPSSVRLGTGPQSQHFADCFG
jgi:hypothetical protein